MDLDPRKFVFRDSRTTQAQTSLHSLIRAYVILFSESIISKLAKSQISIFYLFSVAEETGVSLALSETPKAGFVESKPRSSNKEYRVHTEIQKHNSMIFHDQQCNFHDYLMHCLQPLLLAASSPR